MDQFNKGLSYAEEAIKLDNECAQAWLNQGVLQHQLNMRKQAMESFSQVVQIAVDDDM